MIQKQFSVLIDTEGRYSYQNQIAMISWNLCRFAETLLPLISDDEDKAIDIAQNCLAKFTDLAISNLISGMCSKSVYSNLIQTMNLY